jgi:hypothetical protein
MDPIFPHTIQMIKVTIPVIFLLKMFINFIIGLMNMKYLGASILPEKYNKI